MTNHVRQEIKIHFDGLAADAGSLPVEDLTESLTGWRDFLSLSTSVFLERRFSTAGMAAEHRPEVRVKAPERGSFEVTLELVLSVAGLALALKNDEHAGPALKKLARWIVSLFQKHVEEKRKFHSIQQVADALSRLAREHDIQDTGDPAQSRKITENIDSALKKATFPVDHSAETVTVQGVGDVDDLRLSVARSERGAIQSQFFFKPEQEGAVQAKIIVQALNLKTKRVSGFVPESGHPMFKGLQSGHVKDQSLSKPRNAFTYSLYVQEPVSLWAVPMHDPETNSIKHWDFYGEEPVVETPLFHKPIERQSVPIQDFAFHLQVWENALRSDAFWGSILENAKASARVRDAVAKAVVWLEMKGFADQAKQLDDACQAMREMTYRCTHQPDIHRRGDDPGCQALRDEWAESVKKLRTMVEQVMAHVPRESWEGFNG
ncbi:MAG TPA: hypothetical protein PLD58_05465 [Phycisphaerae bacterium]|nr:hypothetical protein [Phycisphaerae bacterium]